MDRLLEVHYSLRLESGKVVESNLDEEPLVYTLGSGEMIPALEEVLADMEPGEERSGVLPAEAWIGRRDPGALITVPVTHLPAEARQVGAPVRVEGPDAACLEGRVIEVDGNGRAVVDFNPPLAGEPLHYTLKLARRS